MQSRSLDSLDRWKHDHAFGQERPRSAERRTVIVVAITAVTMVVEVTAGLVWGSMALLADGLHMASHAAALGLSAFAYAYARRCARDPRFSFGTGKVNALAGFTGAILLVGFALVMAVESIQRIVHPVVIGYDYAIGVAVLGLIINAVSVLILGGGHTHHHGHDGHGHPRGHDHDSGPHARGAHEHESGPHARGAHERDGRHEPGHDEHQQHRHKLSLLEHQLHEHGRDPHHHSPRHSDHVHHAYQDDDHNLRSAYLHVLADALTSLLAIAALVSGKYLGLAWLDALMGVFGALLVANWSRGLIRQTSRVLLDRQGPPHLEAAIRDALEADPETRICDLHVWSVGPGIYATEIALIARTPRSPELYKARLPRNFGLVHVTVEVNGWLEGS